MGGKVSPGPWPSAPTVALMSTTASFAVAVFEIIVFNGLDLVAQTDKRSAARTISLWWRTTYFHGLSLILMLGISSLTSGIFATQSLEQGTFERYLAIGGTAFAIGHFAFAKPVVATIDSMATLYDEGSKKTASGLDDEAIRLNQRWLKLHLVRTLTADVPALLCWVWLANRRGRD